MKIIDQHHKYAPIMQVKEVPNIIQNPLK